MLRYLRNLVLLSIVALSPGVAAPAQDLPQANDSGKTYPLTGVVVDSISGRPIPRVLVRLTAANRSLLTGPQGEFSFSNVSPGPTEILLTKPGYFHPGAPSGYSPFEANSLPYKLNVVPEMGDVVLKLAPDAVISGTIEGNDEEPLEGVQITVLASRINEGRRDLFPAHRTAVSDEDGNFRITGLTPGRYYLSAKAGRVTRSILGAQANTNSETYPSILYFPASVDLAGAAPLDLAAGQHQEAHFVLKTVPSFKVAGTITNLGEWTRLGSPTLMDEFQQALLNAERFDPQSGQFEFRAVPGGSYWLLLSGSNREGRYVSTYRRLVVQSNLVDLRLAAQFGLDIPIILHTDFVRENVQRGHCRYTTDSGQAQESDCSDYPAARLELHSLDLPRLTFQSDSGPLKAAFSIRGVSPGKYSVRAMATFGGYVQSARCGGIDLLREPLVVPEDGNINPIEVVVRDDPAALRIKVRSEKPGQQTTVLVFPDPLTTTEPQIRTNSQGGEIYAGPLAPGAYKVFAFDAADAFDYSSLEELAKYATQAASITVAASENASVVVDVIHLGE